MATNSERIFDVDKRDLEDPTGLVRLGLQYIGTMVPGGDEALGETILGSYNADELIAALVAAASFSIGLASGITDTPSQTIVSEILKRVPASING